MAATVRDVARKVGVSQEMRDRIQAAIAELNYAPSEVAASLTSSRTELIGMIAPDPGMLL